MCPMSMGNFWTKMENLEKKTTNALESESWVFKKKSFTGPGPCLVPGVGRLFPGLLLLLVLLLSAVGDCPLLLEPLSSSSWSVYGVWQKRLSWIIPFFILYAGLIIECVAIIIFIVAGDPNFWAAHICLFWPWHTLNVAWPPFPGVSSIEKVKVVYPASLFFLFSVIWFFVREIFKNMVSVNEQTPPCITLFASILCPRSQFHRVSKLFWSIFLLMLGLLNLVVVIQNCLVCPWRNLPQHVSGPINRIIDMCQGCMGRTFLAAGQG